ncbi:MAG: peptidoglycan-binding protein, partial [Coriobacteriaceae bacterium]|nr:peptidoglycan-binding protein [Coriobacteriaceae bacterium]
MRPIRTGDRGPAVEDVQRRLLSLGYDLGTDGVDGVFLERTRDAVTAFQRGICLAEDGVVGPRTWAALVDSTFRLGDRLLYLRRPHFHGRDVATLQGALNVLGFSCGGPDGIFGVYTEHAVREFQANCGLVPDGVAGDDTVRAVVNLRHVWEGKDPTAPAALTLAPARR